jgi:hypothetical protein
VAPGQLEEHRALVLELRRHLDRGDQLARREVDLEQALEEVLRLHQALAAGARHHDARIERHHARGILGRGIGERDAAAERAAVADRRVRHVLHRLGEERDMPCDFLGFLELRMRNERADPEHALLEADFPERQARDVDQQLGLRQAACSAPG